MKIEDPIAVAPAFPFNRCVLSFNASERATEHTLNTEQKTNKGRTPRRQNGSIPASVKFIGIPPVLMGIRPSATGIEKMVRGRGILASAYLAGNKCLSHPNGRAK